MQLSKQIQKQKQNQKISICIPLYNGIEFLSESFLSVMNQTYSNYEVLIAVNGHEENSDVYQKTCEIVLPYQATHTIRIFDWFHLKGKSITLNAMMNMCQAEFIALLDVDDIWHPHKLEIQTPILQHFDVVGTQCVYMASGKQQHLNGIIPKIPVGDFTNTSFRPNPIINSSVILHKRYCSWKENGIEDYELWLRLKKSGHVLFYNCPKVLVKHRLHDASAFNSKGHLSKLSILDR